MPALRDMSQEVDRRDSNLYPGFVSLDYRKAEQILLP